jgi:uncharacterized membrane protein YkvA (DUF1232 family)
MTDHFENLETWAGRLRTEVYALYLAYRDPRVPLHARVFAACVVGYAFSPIDLIPDPIPLGVTLAIRMIPEPVLLECREKARRASGGSRLANRVVAAAVVVVWLALATLAVHLTVRSL